MREFIDAFDNLGTCYEDKTKLGFLEEKVCSALGKNDDHLPSYEILVHGETADQVYMPFFESGFPGGDKKNPFSFLSGFLIRGADMNSPLAVTVSGLSCAQSEYIMERLHIMKSDRRCTKGQNAEFIMGSGRRRLSGNTMIKITAGGFANVHVSLIRVTVLLPQRINNLSPGNDPFRKREQPWITGSNQELVPISLKIRPNARKTTTNVPPA